MPPFLTSLLGILAILAIAFALSSARRRINLRVVGAAFALQALIAFIVLHTPWGVAGIKGMSNGVAAWRRVLGGHGDRYETHASRHDAACERRSGPRSPWN